MKKDLSFVKKMLYKKSLDENENFTQSRMASELGFDGWANLIYHLRPENDQSKHRQRIAEYLGVSLQELEQGLVEAPV